MRPGVRDLPGAITAAWLALIGAAAFTAAAPPFPSELDQYFENHVKLTREQRGALMAGRPVTKLLDADPSKEVAVFGAVWIDAPIDRYLAAVRDIERFESGDAFRVTKKIGAPPRLDDFAQLVIPAEDVKDLRSCKLSQCELKLPASAIERMQREVDWRRPDVNEQVNRISRDQALRYVTAYLAGGNAELAVYRDADRPTFVAQEFASLVDRLPALGEFIPKVRRYLLDFPNAALPSSESFLYWQDANFGLKPTIRINHLVMTQDAGGAVVASKMLYASHYFWTALELRVLVRDPQRGAGFWFVTESRSRSDGLAGFVGKLIRGKVRGEAEKGAVALLQLTKSRLEAK